MHKRNIIIGYLLILFLVISCAPKGEEIKGPSKDTTEDQKGLIGTIKDEATEDFKECDLNQDPLKIEKILPSMFEKGIVKNDQGIVFDLKALDAKDNIIPVDGRLNVLITTSKIVNNERVKGNYDIFSFNYPIKKSQVAKDCSTKNILIPFSAIESSTFYKYVEANDPGLLFFEFSRTGSGDRFTKTYYPTDGKEDLLHR